METPVPATPMPSRVQLTLEDRIASYERAFPDVKGSLWIATTKTPKGDRRWLYGVFQIGNEYSNPSNYYGAFPRSFPERIAALFPEVADANTLHVFSGSLPPGKYTRIDINPALGPEIVGSVYDLPQLTTRRFKLVVADPPYSAADAEHYGTAGVNRGRATRAIAQVVDPGGHLVWLDTTWPMHRSDEWNYYGSILLVRCTNHRVRAISLFERKAAA